MATKKQGFIKTYIGRPISLIRKALSLIPSIIPFTKNKKIELDQWSKMVREKLKNPALSNYELGKKFFSEGNHSDAITRFKIACYMKKDYALSYFMMAKSYLAIGKNEKAIASLKKAKESKLQNDEFTYFTDIYLEQKYNIQPNEKLRKDHFNVISSVMDPYYIQNFNYNGIEKISELFEQHNTSESNSILELGCGNGFLGVTIKTAHPNISITGLDYSDRMIENAKLLKAVKNENETHVIDLKNNNDDESEVEVSVYDYLIRTDLNNYAETKTKYDVVLARGIFNYIQDYNAVIKNISKLLKKGGIFILFLRNPLEDEQYNSIRDDFSFPYYSNFIIHDSKKFVTDCEKSSLKLVARQDFTLELDYCATILILKKS